MVPVDSPSPGMQQSSQVRSIIARDQGASIQTFPPATYGFVSRSPLILDPILLHLWWCPTQIIQPRFPTCGFWYHLDRYKKFLRPSATVHGSKDKNPWDNVTFSRLVIGSNFCHVFLCLSLWLAFLACHPLLPQLLRPCSGSDSVMFWVPFTQRLGDGNHDGL